MDFTRIINTGFTDDKAMDALSAVIGQMSDGYWEDNSAYDGYWMTSSVVRNEEGVIEIHLNEGRDFYKGRYYSRPWGRNKWYDMTDAQVINFFARKIEFIAKVNAQDYRISDYRNSQEVCTYLDYKSGLRFCDAFSTAKALNEVAKCQG